MPYTLIVKMNGKLIFSHAGLPEAVAGDWEKDFAQLVKGSPANFETEIVEEMDRLPSPCQVVNALLEQLAVERRQSAARIEAGTVY